MGAVLIAILFALMFAYPIGVIYAFLSCRYSSCYLSVVRYRRNRS